MPYNMPGMTPTQKADLTSVTTTVNSNSSVSWSAQGVSAQLVSEFNTIYVTTTGSSTTGSLTAEDITITAATLNSAGDFTGTGIYLTLNINGSALYLPLYKQ